LLWLFWRWGLSNYLQGLALNLDPPDLSLPSSWDYSHEPLVPFNPQTSCKVQMVKRAP
jgi:hypothetical protein